MNLEPLQKIGLTPGEIKVYLALLHLGTSTAGPIAQDAKVARSKLYDILDRLAKKGMVSHVIHNGTKEFSVAEPSRFLDFLKKKEEDIRTQQIEMKHLLPQLEQEFELQKVKSDAEVFDGLEGLKHVRERCIKTMQKGDCIYFFGVPSSAYHRMEAYYAEWNERRIAKRINSYTVFTDEARTHPYVKTKIRQQCTQIRFLPKRILTHAWTEIYGDIVVIAINYKKSLSIVIKNKYVAESYRHYFDMLWSISKQ
ncbi:MAG: helix-turn-helix domain-containing protein [Nanoarchaeota archaeon]